MSCDVLELCSADKDLFYSVYLFRQQSYEKLPGNVQAVHTSSKTCRCEFLNGSTLSRWKRLSAAANKRFHSSKPRSLAFPSISMLVSYSLCRSVSRMRWACCHDLPQATLKGVRYAADWRCHRLHDQDLGARFHCQDQCLQCTRSVPRVTVNGIS